MFNYINYINKLCGFYFMAVRNKHANKLGNEPKITYKQAKKKPGLSIDFMGFLKEINTDFFCPRKN